jgi:hypothetical protein
MKVGITFNHVYVFISDKLALFEEILKPLPPLLQRKKGPGLAEMHKYLATTGRGITCLPRTAFMLVAVKYAESLVHQKVPTKTETTKSSETTGKLHVTNNQTEILEYISGAILHKLKKRYQRLGMTSNLDNIAALVDLNPPTTTLIAAKSRGGLLTPVSELMPLVISGYNCFNRELQQADYFCAEVLEQFPEDQLPDVTITVLEDILKLLHKILCHHECFKFLEHMKIPKKCTGRGRALRCKLADKNTL